MGNWHSGIEDRTYYDVVYQGLLMVLAGWISIHPNVPSKQVAGKVPLWGKFFMFNRKRLIVLIHFFILPEAAVVWAVRQQFAARALRNQYKEHGWTITHGYFLVMGGFTKIYPDQQPGGQIRVSEFLEKENRIVFPKISESEILDRSKQDGVAFFSFLFLAVEFWARQIVRATILKLRISRLESLTASMALIFFVVRLIWLFKPMDVQFSVPLQILPGETEDDSQSSPPPSSQHSPLSPFHARIHVRVISALLNSFSQMLGSIPAEENNPLTNEFYCPNSDGLDGIVPAVLCGLGIALFIGIVHRCSWNSHCSWPFIQTLWRTLSIATVVIPLVFCSLCAVVAYLANSKGEKKASPQDSPLPEVPLEDSRSQKEPLALPALTRMTEAVAFLHIAVRFFIFVLILVEVFQMRDRRSPDVYVEFKWTKMFNDDF